MSEQSEIMRMWCGDHIVIKRSKTLSIERDMYTFMLERNAWVEVRRNFS